MHQIGNKKWMPLLMALTILAIAGFQVYWIDKSYEREKRTLDMRTNMQFRETVRSLQSSKLKLDRLALDSSLPPTIRLQTGGQRTNVKLPPREKMATLMDVVLRRTTDSGKSRIFLRRELDSLQASGAPVSPRQNRIMQFLFDVDSLQDSLRVKEIEGAYAKKLDEQNVAVPFQVSRVPTKETEERIFNEVTLGFAAPVTYRLDLGNTFPFLLKRILPAILFSVFLVGFTLLSFTLLYRNLLRQRRLADIKNEFISNITHELKTPIATVSVAIEALRSFSASMNPQKTKEYLDISANELQRLSLLVDKVLKLSMFEKKEIELKYEPLDMQALVDEVTGSMRLQFEKHKAEVTISATGNTTLQGDRLHLVSVLFNLLDNALKYTPASPKIAVVMEGQPAGLRLQIADNGIGIEPEYRERIFEKFFRVPQGNVHNAKGYGLGLSYVAHVVEKHGGSINVASEPGGGSRFTIVLPQGTVA